MLIQEFKFGVDLIEEGIDYDMDENPIHPYLEYVVTTNHIKQEILVVENKEYSKRFIYSFIKLIKDLGGIQEIVPPHLYKELELMMNDFADLEDYENAQYLKEEMEKARQSSTVI